MRTSKLQRNSRRNLAIGTVLAGGLLMAGIWAPTAVDAKGAQEPQPTTRKSTDPPLRPTGKLGQDLFLAIDHRDVNEVKNLLKNGADPNSRNGLLFTPLYIASASHQPDVMEALISAGAEIDAESPYGTALTFAAISGHTAGIKMLIGKGADVNNSRVDGLTPLLMAANSGSAPAVAELLANKADVKATGANDSSALHLAARGGFADVSKILLDAGAPVEAVDRDRRTPLMAAAMTGRTDVVSLLIKAGAKVDARDAQGQTAAILAAANGDYVDVIRALKDAGADLAAKDNNGRTAAAFAARRGFTASAGLLGKPNAAELNAVGETPTVRRATERSLEIIQSSMKDFSSMTKCVSCHQEGLGRITTASARKKGFKTDADLEKVMSERVNGVVNALQPLHEQALTNPEAMKQLPLIEVNEIVPLDSWILAGQVASGEPATKATESMTMILGKQQKSEGCWTFSLPRVPMQSSIFTMTAYSIQALNAYGDQSKKAEVQAQIQKAKDWLLNATPKTSEDRAFRLLGLKWAGASDKELSDAIAAIRADQRPDGGWSQLPNMQSDAYATGQALYALHIGGGVSTKDALYQRGTQYLLRTQYSDGSWFVNKRAIPANNYFDAGFPHGESQYSSFNGTCWATLALLEALGESKK
ncbi:MAG: ankyrin repeat domain-containing protein [Fimbriimonadaceae bacterium]|nr:ankyrin repeat domain-containing protein [Fimbriimonadaceae bacterium]